MAPTRRKGANKATAAARRQWKVGDLVLAKVKGFPPWPATVSEPGKWGYAADQKKVLVYFFGTRQIAFCNPGDVEAFTEEKKESLLVRHHRKSADFVRALHEIIESYEKLKRQDQINNANITVEDTVPSENNSGELSIRSYANGEAPDTTFQSCLKKSHSVAEDDVNIKSESDAAAARQEGPQDRDMPAKEVMEMALENTDSSREIFERTQSQKCFRRRRLPSARRARGRADSSKVQNFITHSGNVTASVFRDGSGRRNKRIRKSPDIFDGHVVDSHDLVSTCSIEGNDSEILTADSDSLSLNEGSTVESECKDIEPDSVIQLCPRNAELSQRLDFQTNGIYKKKRMPNRKRPSSEVIEFNAGPNEKIASDTDVVRSQHISSSDQERSIERFPKEDGDEHLPLVKRARVRMGRASSTGLKPETLLDTEEKPPEVCNSLSDHVHVSSNREGDGSTDQNPFPVKGDKENSPPPNKSHAMKHQVWEVRKNQQFGSSLDGEAALPPSKRLHRALEAMSANAAEDNQTASDVPSTTKAETNVCSYSPSDDRSKLSLERKLGSEYGVSLAEENLCNKNSQDAAHEFSVQSDLLIEEGRISSGDEATRSIDSSKNKPCKDVDSSDHKNLLESSSGDVIDAALILECSKSLSPKGAHVKTNDSPGVVLPSDGGCNTEKNELAKSLENLDYKTSLLSSNLLAGENVTIHSPHSGTKMQTDSADANFDETMKLCQLIVEKNTQVNEMSKDVGEIGPTIRDSSATLFPIPVDVMSFDNEDPDDSRSYSVSDDHSGEKTISVTQSSSSMTDGLDSILRATPHNSSSNAPVSVNNSVQVNGSCSPAVRSHHDTQSFAVKWNYKESHAALRTFESIVGSLTRTKESIGRATRTAIDCAKFGVASKVVEILAHNLERESSLHRRVDLFFLVDSIAQCSRCLKGDVGGIYPSAILAVLPRLLLAAAPPGSSCQENRRQCLKVLRVWQERKILPESIVRHHIRELDSLCGSSCSRAFSRRPRNERAFDDPIREMEGMLVDEYGSNSSIQLPGFCMPPMLRDEDDGIDSDGESFEAVTPEHDTEKSGGDMKPIPVVEKHRHILEDVDGELEMEDVAPSSDAAVFCTSDCASTDILQTSHHSIGNPAAAAPFAPPLPKDPPMSPPLPVSPPPPLPLPLPLSLSLPPPPLPPPRPPPPFPLPLPLAVPQASFPIPSERPDCISNSLSSKVYTCSQNIEDDLRKSTAEQSIAPGVNLMISDAAQCSSHGPTDFQSQVPKLVANSTNCSFSSPPVIQPPIQAVNNPPADAAFNKGFHLRPPHPAPSNQFSYVQADQRVQSRRDIMPPSHPNRFHVQNTDNGNFYRDHDRMKLASNDIGEHWRAPPPFPGPRYPEGSRMPYAPAPYAGQLGGPALPSNNWALPPCAMNPMPHRPPSGGLIPVAVRGPSGWRPR